MLLLAFRSFFFIAVILGYSTGIWRLINDYFRREFQSYLEVESQTNRYLLRDPPKATGTVPDVPDNQLPVGEPAHDDGGGDHPHQQVTTDSIMALSEHPAAGAKFDAPAGSNYRREGAGRGGEGTGPPEVMKLGDGGGRGEAGGDGVTLPVTVVVAAAPEEVTDIRSRHGKQTFGTEEGDVSEREKKGEEEEDKWISYWSERGRKADALINDNANAYCTVAAGQRFALPEALTGGAVTRIREQTDGGAGDAFGCD
uniref:Uncharacterized protein n=1 Tax=Anopheles epiroticus TaxID=199890 RepID=A0A182PLJ6_9DIPT